jgi:hypothetical protein
MGRSFGIGRLFVAAANALRDPVTECLVSDKGHPDRNMRTKLCQRIWVKGLRSLKKKKATAKRHRAPGAGAASTKKTSSILMPPGRLYPEKEIVVVMLVAWNSSVNNV